MKKVLLDDLQVALEIVKPAIAKKELIEQSTSFAFADGKVLAYNDEVYMSHPVEGLDLFGAIKAEELYGIISKIKEKEILLDVTDNEVVITAGRTQVGLLFESEIKLPLDQIDSVTEMIPIEDEFLDKLSFASMVTDTNFLTPVLTCVHVDKNTLSSSDNRRLCHITLKQDTGIENLLLPAKIVPLIIKMQASKIAVTESWVHFENEVGTKLSARIFSGKFPQISGIISVVPDIEIELPANLTETIDRAEVFSKKEYEKDELITIELSKKKLILKSKSDSGWFKEVNKCDYADADILSFDIQPIFLKDILTKTNICHISKKSNMVIFKEANKWIYLTKVELKRKDK